MHTSIYRYVGNAFLMSGYYIILYGDQKIGLIVKCFGGLMTIPFAIKYKLWDVLIVCGFFTIIEISKLIHLYSS